MTALVSLLIILFLSILISRIATVALTHTGLSREAARFQARSAFTGAGFTTGESEKIVSHPVRRRIVLLLMLLGNAGIVTTISTLILSFAGLHEARSAAARVALLLAGLVLLWVAAVSSWVDVRLSRLISWALQRYTRLDVRDYASLLHLTGQYRILELHVQQQDWLANSTLAQLKLKDEGVAVLGIRRGDGTYIGAPKGHSRILPGDTMLLYGRIHVLQNIDERLKGSTGDDQHNEAVAEQSALECQECTADPVARGKRSRA